MTTEKLTPEYIAEQQFLGNLTNEQLTELIRDYGSEQADEASYWAAKESGY